MQKIVLTGAAGRLGSYLREPLSRLANELVSTDIESDIGKLYPGERYQAADLASFDAISEVLYGADMVIHFGAIGDEAPFEEILQANILGAYNIWEAAYHNGLQRVVYASSIHAVGLHASADKVGVDVSHKPDTYYGLAKCFAEDLGKLYWHRRQLEAVCLRICSCAPVNNQRALGTWLSYPDLIHLVERAVQAEEVGFKVVYGVSDNDRSPVDNHAAREIGFKPVDNAEQFADEVFAETPPMKPQAPELALLGGPFATVELGHSGTASMNIISEKKKR